LFIAVTFDPTILIEVLNGFLLVIVHVILKNIIFEKANVIITRIMVNTANNYKMLHILPHNDYGKSSPKNDIF